MDTSNFWWQSAGDGPGPGPDPGDPIGQSLRFRGAQSLINTALRTTGTDNLWTLSLWVKLAEFASQGAHLFRGDVGGSSQGFISLLTSNTTGQGYWTVNCGTSSNGFIPSKRFRDPSAWQHWVLAYNGANENIDFTVNGEAVTEGDFGTNILSTGAIIDQIHFGSTNPWEGYLADVYFIDGQALEPTAFGRYNTEGVWVPREVDFTPAGPGDDFIYSAGLKLTAGQSFAPAFPLANGFDGNLSTFCEVDPNGGTFNYAPDTPIPFTKEIAFYADGNMNPTTWDGNNFTNPGSTGWFTFQGSGELSAATPIIFQASNSYNNFYAIRVDGQILIDGVNSSYGPNGFHLDFADPNDLGADRSGNGNDFTATGFEVGNQSSPDYDLMQDSPTQNFATLNPLYPNPSASLSDANLRVDDSNGSYAPPNPASIKLDGKCYWEVTPTVAGGSGYPYVGVCILDPTLSSNTVFQQALYVNPNGNGGNFGVSISNNSFSTGTVLGFAYDSSNRQLTVTYDGTNSQTFTASGTAELTPMVAAAVGAGANVNYGQQPFLYQPAGFSALQTQNLPEATITDGRDHFQAITGGLATYYIESGITNADGPIDLSTEVPFGQASANIGLGSRNSGVVDLGSSKTTADVTWVYAMSSNVLLSLDGQTWRNLGVQSIPSDGATVTYSDGSPFQYVRLWRTSGDVFQNGILGPAGNNILALAQNTFPNGLWWIKDRVNSNQHQLVDSVRGGNLALTSPALNLQQAYVAPAGSSIAWCWNYNAANPAENGFEILQSSESETINHSLGATPEFVISKGITGLNTAIRVHHSAVGFSQTLLLSTNEAQQASSERVTAADATTLTYAGLAGTDYVHYAWTSVPGYSAFGSYTGNGDTSGNGPFIYTGFRPAFVMMKAAVGATGSWMILDSTRSINNPSRAQLRADLTTPEVSDIAYDVDFLSNGFKPRYYYSNNNSAGVTYVYAAFAENPFGGSNVSPANAR